MCLVASISERTGMGRWPISPYALKVGQQHLEMILSVLVTAPGDRLRVVQYVPRLVTNVL